MRPVKMCKWYRRGGTLELGSCLGPAWLRQRTTSQNIGFAEGGCNLSLGCACEPFGHARSTQHLHCSTRTENHSERESLQTSLRLTLFMQCATVSAVLVICHSFTMVGSSGFRNGRCYNGWRSFFSILKAAGVFGQHEGRYHTFFDIAF